LAVAGITTRVFLVTDSATPPPDLPEFVEVLRARDIFAGRCERL
jgi:hypothetical protein